MKKLNTIAIISILIVALLLVGCANQAAPEKLDINEDFEEQETEDTEQVMEEPQEMVEPKPEPQTETDDTEEKEETKESSYNFEALPKEEQIKIKLVRKLLEEAKSSEENYFFRLSGPNTPQTDVWVKGDIMKRQIYRPAELDKYTTYNMVFLNRKTLKAEGYCETTKAKCWKGHGPFPETFSKWDVKTPKDWIIELGDDFRWGLDNKIADQLYHIVDFPQKDRTVRVYVNDYKGWPARVEIYPPGTKVNSVTTKSALETYIYDDLDIGGVSEDDVTPRR